MNLNRRSGILAALSVWMASARPAEAADPLTFTTTPTFRLPEKWRFTLSLDGMDGLDVTRGGKTIHISPDEIFAALERK